MSVEYRGTVLHGSTGSSQFHTSQEVTSPRGDPVEGARVTLYFTEATACSGVTKEEQALALRSTTDAKGRFYLETIMGTDPWMKSPALFCVTHPEYKTLSVRVILQERAGPRVDFVLEPKTK